ncbi:MAG: hypothetical protein Q7K55_01705 [Candidatus Levybacteria bacterium]|nr:hypothetical protein [Candidatus Levybacteria bacterium]
MAFIENLLNRIRQPNSTEQKSHPPASKEFSVDEKTLTDINDSLKIHPYGTQYPLHIEKKEPDNEFNIQPGLYCYTGIKREKWEASILIQQRCRTILNETFQALGLIGVNDKLSFEYFLTPKRSIILKLEKPLNNFK